MKQSLGRKKDRQTDSLSCGYHHLLTIRAIIENSRTTSVDEEKALESLSWSWVALHLFGCALQCLGNGSILFVFQKKKSTSNPAYSMRLLGATVNCLTNVQTVPCCYDTCLSFSSFAWSDMNLFRKWKKKSLSCTNKLWVGEYKERSRWIANKRIR